MGIEMAMVRPPRCLLVNVTTGESMECLFNPPRTLFIWPEVLTVEAVVADVEFQYRQISVDGEVLVYAATMTFEEILDARVTSEDLREEV